MTAPETPAPTPTPEERKKAEASNIAAAVRRKVALATTALLSAALGIVFTILFLVDAEFLLRHLHLGSLLDGLQRWLETNVSGPDGTAVDAVRIVRLVSISILNFVLFVLALVAALVLGASAGKRAEGGTPLPGSHASNCLALTRASTRTGWMEILAGLLIGITSVVLTVRYGAFPLSLDLYPAVLGLAQGFVALGLATLVRLGILLDDPDPREIEAPPPPPAAGKARATGMELLMRLRQSPVYRRQVVLDRPLPGFAFQEAADDGMKILATRFPRLVPILKKHEIVRLTLHQRDALEKILAVDHTRGVPMDFALVGPAGTGRATLANMISLGTALNREGAVYCLTAESPQRNVSIAQGGQQASVRHPVVQIREWLKQAGLTDHVRVAESYADRPETLDLDSRPDLVFTDIRRLSSALLQELHGQDKDGARDFLRRLQYVIIDHPQRLSREDMMRLRIALTRLRLTAEQLGSSPTFLVILPEINNAVEVTKYLVNNFHVEQLTFTTWTASTHLVGWLPPLEVLDFYNDEEPLLVRSAFFDEAEALLCEIGYQSNQLADPLRVAIVDSRPLLGPEARMHVRDRVGEALAREAGEGRMVQVRHQWAYFGTQDIAIDRRHEFDLILALGVGPHPGLLVSSLRAAIADQGALILVGDSSPADLESLRQIGAQGWEPPGQAESPSYSLPDMSEAVVAHELACLLEDFRELQERTGQQDTPFAILLDRLFELFPGEHTRRLLDSWREEGYLEDLAVFERVREQNLPQERAALRCTATELRGSQFEVPWGCSTRHVYRVRDTAANDLRAVGRFLNDFIDHHRMFIDFHPEAVLRHAPNSVRITGLARRELDRREQEALQRRYVELGEVEVATLPQSDCLALDRRAPRLECTLMRERPGRAERGWTREENEDVAPLLDPLSAILKVSAPENLSAPKASAHVLSQKAGLVGSARSQVVGTGGSSPLLQLISGVWKCQIQERLRDVVTTDERLIEEPVLVTCLNQPENLRLNRSLEALAVNLLLRRLPTRRFGASRHVLFLLDSSVAVVQPPPSASGETPWSATHALAQALNQARTLLRELVPHEDLKVGLWLMGTVADLRLFQPDTRELPAATAWSRLEELFLTEEGLFKAQTTQAAGSVLEALRRVLDLGQDFDAQKDLEATPLPPWIFTVTARDEEQQKDPAQEWLDRQCERGSLVVTPWTLYADGAKRRKQLEIFESALQASLEGADQKPSDELKAAQRSRAAHQALAGLLGHYLQSRYLNFDSEFRVAVVPCEGPHGERSAHFTSFRLLVHRLHADESSFSQSSLFQQALEPGFLPRFLQWAWEKLEGCTCKDGCSCCCLGMGKVPEFRLPLSGYKEEDAVSRKGAYLLTCALLARKPDWTRFNAGGEDEEPPKPPPGGDDLAQALAEIIGTKAGRYRDGAWARLFGGFMDLDAAWVASASWEEPWTQGENCPAYYNPNTNQTKFKKGVDRQSLRNYVLHEYAHNWQDRGGKFNEEHQNGNEARQYFPNSSGASKLVIEGHARWSENQRMMQVDGRPVHRPSDRCTWNEYKTGFFLMEGIEKAVGEEGLKAWLCRPGVYDWNSIRSRDPGLGWPFTLTQALRHLGLEKAARTGTSPHDDIIGKLERELQTEDPPG